MAKKRFEELSIEEIDTLTARLDDFGEDGGIPPQSREYYAKFFDFGKMGPIEAWNFLSDQYSDDEERQENLSRIPDILRGELERIGLDRDGVMKFLNWVRGREAEKRFRPPEEAEIDWRKDFFAKLSERCMYITLWKDAPVVIDDSCEEQIGFAKSRIRESSDGDRIILYRGQSDASWTITPSMMRGLKVRDEDGDVCKGIYLDKAGMYGLYNENGYRDSLIKKYNKYYGPKPVLGPEDIDYRFLAWMQHAVEFSPLVDFTSDYCTALSFGVKARNPNEFLFVDSAIYIYELPNFIKPITEFEAVDSIVSEMSIFVNNEKIVPGGSAVAFDLSLNKFKEISHKSYASIVKRLIPKYAVIDIQPNDRMLRQRGKFFLLYDYEIVAGKVFDMLDRTVGVTKHIVKANQKKELLEWLRREHPEVDLRFLMNPYLDFED